MREKNSPPAPDAAAELTAMLGALKLHAGRHQFRQAVWAGPSEDRHVA
jgi:hypothetical protein